MGTTLKWLVIFILGIGVGIWYTQNEMRFNEVQSVLFLTVSIFSISYAVLFLHVVYVVRFSKNMREVEGYLNKAKKHPYYNTALHIINGEFHEAENLLPKIKNKGLQAVCKVILHLENKKLSEASEDNKSIKDPNIRHCNDAMIAMLQNDWQTFEEMKNKINNGGYQYMLDAEVAFRKGRYDEAKRIGVLAIKHTAGLQRFILIKSLERQERNPNRESYF